MKISIATLFPELYENFLKTSIIKRAIEKNIVSFDIVRLSDVCKPKERVDEPVCGPGAGMIIKPEIIEKAIEHIEKKNGPGFKIFFSPQGRKLSQSMLRDILKNIVNINIANIFNNKLNTKTPNLLPNYIKKNNIKEFGSKEFGSKEFGHIILICSRYEGIDARVKKYYADGIISIGDYVLMGGDLPAQVFLEGLLRLIPGIVGKQESVERESFSNHLLDYPEYGLPKTWKNIEIPEVILSGNHEKIENYREEAAYRKTILERFDYIRTRIKNKKDIDKCKKFIPGHYIAIMHTDILLKDGRIGCSSVTSLDLHDTARSCATYGIKNMFMVSPLIDQTNIMNELINFWKSDEGKKYNITRFQAVSKVVPTDSLDKTIEFIEKKEGKKPVLISTSAKQHEHAKIIDFHSQGHIFKQERPVLFLFGTAHGLSDNIINKSDFLLVPVTGMTDYTHLSVRSAVGIILDRWLGLNPLLINQT